MLRGKFLAIGDVLGRICICLFFIPAMVRRIIDIHQTFDGPDFSAVDIISLASDFASFLFFGMIIVVTTTRLPPIRSADSAEPFVTAMAGTFILGLISYLPPAMEITLSVRLTAMAFMIVGFLASIYVLLWLGRAFSIMPEARTLVTTGPYAIVRHPLYLTEELFVIGIIILQPSIWSVLLGIFHWGLQLRRMANEERILSAAFANYAEFARGVPRVIPSIFIIMNPGKTAVGTRKQESEASQSTYAIPPSVNAV